MRAEKTEASTAVTVRGFGDQENRAPVQYAAASPATASQPQQNQTFCGQVGDAGNKAFTTLQAQAALNGFRLDRIEADDGKPAYCVTKWALTKQLLTLQDVAAFLDRAGVGHGG